MKSECHFDHKLLHNIPNITPNSPIFKTIP